VDVHAINWMATDELTPDEARTGVMLEIKRWLGDQISLPR